MTGLARFEPAGRGGIWGLYMDEIARRIGALAPAQLEHLDRKIRARGLPLSRASAAPRDPLSFAQERLWFLDQFHPGMPICNLPAVLRLPGSLDVPALERALTELVRRHESLRTTFPAEHGKPVQRIAPAQPITLPLTDLRTLPAGAREAELQRLIAQETHHVFDLARGPLVRALLVRVDDLDHALVITTHHIVSDGWSTGVLLHELAALHAAFTSGRPSPLAELPLQYADHARQQRDQLQGERLAALLGYWKQALDGAPTMLELPADRRRPTVPSFRGASQPLVLEPEVGDRLERLAQREHVTLYTVLLAAFDALLFRYTGQHDIVVGTPIANRDRADLEPLIGLVASTLVIRTRLHGTLTFRDLVAQVREVTLGAHAHQELPFEKLVEELHPDRALSHDPVFQVMFALQRAATPVPPAPLDAHPQITLGRSRFDLTLSMVEHTDGLGGTIEYSTDLFDHATITRMIGHLRTLLAHVAASPDQPLQQLPLLTDAERHEILVTWNATGADYPAEACVHELVEAQVDRTPDALAVVFQDRSASYRQLDERANRLAHRLRSLGVGPEVRVGLCAERSLDMVVGALAILKAGGAYLPLDPTYPPQRLATVLEEARVPVLVTTSHSEHVLPRYAARIIRIDHVLHGESHRPARTASPDSLAYVIYSSGSTGTPKGIEVVHRGVCNIATYQARRFGVYRGDRALQFFSLGFDAWLWDVLLALTAGATLYVAPEEIRGSGPALAEFLARHRIHVATLLPSVLAVMPQIPLPDLHTLIAGGEVCSADVVAAWAPGRRFFNVYGPTEASIAATVSRCVADGRRPTIGRPVDNTTAYILDANLAPVPIGVTGELYLGGIGVARGYFERPALTAARFVADPFSDAPGARLCRTGDLARHRPTGEGAAGFEIELLGRIDDQVKVRGMRIELSEIEAVLRRHPAIHEATVVLRDGPPGLQLAAYLVLASGHLASARELRELLRQTLPAYMVPVTFTFLDRLPRAGTGKIDVRALPEPAFLDRTRDAGLVAPRNATERVVAEIWQDILGVERVGVHDNFFDLGGHSLAAARVLSRIHERWKLDVAVCRFLDAPTVAALAELVAGPFVADPGPSALDELVLHGPAALLARVGELSAAEVDALLETLSGPSQLARLSSAEKRTLLARSLQDKARLAKPYPLSFAQERLWFLDQLQPGVPIYNLPAALRLPGPLNVPALERTVTEIVRRHEALRTTFPAEHGKPVQRIAPARPVTLPLADLRTLPAEAREAELQRLIAQETHHVFDLARGPLVRALLVRVDDLDHALVLVTHHIVSDGWSTRVLVQEVSALYAAFAAGRPSPLAELPLQYADHAQQQRDRLQGDRLAALLGYWKRALDGAPTTLELPTDRPRPAVQSFRGARQEFVLGRELGDQLEALARREGATLFMVLLAAFDALLFRYTGQHDIVVGTPIANRNRADLEPLIGLFANTLVIRTRLHGALTFRDLVAQVREVTLGAYAHQELPFEKLVEELHPDRTPGHDPVFQVMFALQSAPHAPQTAELSLSIVEQAGGLGGTIEYSTDLFDHATITRMIGHLQTLLAHAAASPRQPLHLLSMLTDAERHQILVTWNDTRTDYPDDACVHELVEAQVDRTPDARAVVFQDQALTYRQLDERANRLAHRLRSLGVGPEVRVGLCVERSLDMVVGTLAILKAGGVYLPLDPAQPRDRLAFMLADARPRVVLVQPQLVASVPTGAHHAIALDSAWDEIEGQPDHRPTNLVTPESALAVFYTSGSAAVGHIRGFVNLFHWYRGVAAIGPGSRVLLMTPFAFDASFKNLLTPLVAGGTVVLAGPGDDVRAIASTIERERVTTTFTTPSLLDPMLEAAAERDYAPLASLETLFIGGESAEVARLRTWLASPGCRCRVIHVPGASECSDVFTSFVPPPRCLHLEHGMAIGRPIANARAYVLDADGGLLPIGVPGELCVSGMGVGRGYLDRPRLTADKLVPDPFLRGERLYRTGDRARWLASGEIDFLGRIDQPVELQPAPEAVRPGRSGEVVDGLSKAEVDALSQTRK